MTATYLFNFIQRIDSTLLIIYFIYVQFIFYFYRNVKAYAECSPTDNRRVIAYRTKKQFNQKMCSDMAGRPESSPPSIKTFYRQLKSPQFRDIRFVKVCARIVSRLILNHVLIYSEKNIWASGILMKISRFLFVLLVMSGSIVSFARSFFPADDAGVLLVFLFPR